MCLAEKTKLSNVAVIVLFFSFGILRSYFLLCLFFIGST
ncbi:unnamed protein product [Brassica rapa]|uniref:Uncharacterized protein n=1 Tax=Brassica campestris TaxID=3711 RepID=A0A8D9D5Y4_BRACM|nr:unnamed protein product [Brassica rapa]